MIAAMFRAFLGFVLVISAVFAADNAQKRYPLADHGALVVTVPSRWVAEVRQEGKLPPTIGYSLAAGKPPQVLITPVWRVRADVPPFTQESVRKNVEHAVSAVKDQAVEKEIPVQQFKGKSGAGYYFEATDRAPKPGEFKFLRQGMLAIGDILLAFTVLADSRDEPVMGQALTMLQGATHAPK